MNFNNYDKLRYKKKSKYKKIHILIYLFLIFSFIYYILNMKIISKTYLNIFSFLYK